MGKLGEAVVEIMSDIKGLDSGLADAKGKLSGFARESNKILAAMGVGLSLGLAAHQIADAAGKAMDFGETLSKVNATFGKDGKQITDTADELASKFGLVKKTVMDGATSIGLVGQAAGMASRQSAQLGAEMAKLAADVESFSNVPLDQVLAAFRSGMVGESEPMRQFGVLLSEDAVKAEALRLGLAKTTGAISEQAKVMARVSLIKNSPAIQKMAGDLERTADSGKNQLRKFMGDLENLKTELGANLIGPMTEGIKLARELGASLNDAFKGTGGAGGIGEELKSVIAALRLVHKVQTAKPGELRGKTLQGVADEQVEGLAKTGGHGKGEKADRQREADRSEHAAYLKSKGFTVDQIKKIMTVQSTLSPEQFDSDATKNSFFDMEAKAKDIAKSDTAKNAIKFAQNALPSIMSKGILGGVVKTVSDKDDKEAKARQTVAGAYTKINDFAVSSLGNASLKLAQAALPNILNKGLGRGLVATGVDVASLRPEKKEKEKTKIENSVQTFESSADFARFAAEKAMEGQKAQEQVQEIQKSNSFLSSIDEGISALKRTMGNNGPIIFRGRS